MNTKSMKRTSSKETKISSNIDKRFNKDDEISCKSLTIGTLIMTGPKSKEDYLWTGYGDATDVQYQDLTALINRKSEYIYSPLFIVEDEEFLNQFPKLRQFYDEQITESDLEEILNLNNRDMINAINKLPVRAKETLKIIASTNVSSGAIDSLSKIKALDECFGTELNLLQSLIN